MGALTLAGIIISAVGAGVTGVGGVLIGCDLFAKTAKKTCDSWKEEATKNLKEATKNQK